MSTKIRASISKKNKYWIEKHRYYELKHFCLQYPIWVEAYNSLDGLSKKPDFRLSSKTNSVSNPTSKCVESMEYYREKIDMLKEAANRTDEALACYILEGVTKGMSYDMLQLRCVIPCSKNMYYELYRKFFWILNKLRN